MTRSLFIALREIRTYLQDKADLAFSLVLPIAIFAVMYVALSAQSLFQGTAYVVNEDQEGIYSTLFLERLDELQNLSVKLLSPVEADSKLERSDILLVVYVPQEFSARLASQEPVQLIFRQRGNGGEGGQIVASLVRGVVDGMNQEFLTYSQIKEILAEEDISQERIETTTQKFFDREREQPIVQVRKNILGSSPDPVKTFFPAIVTMFILFAITLNARTLVEERKKGTLERLLTTRLTVSEIFLGKFLANTSRGFVQAFILLALAYAVFQLFTPLSFLTILVIALVFAAATSALGLAIASIARTESQATWIAVFFTMVTVMLGGTFFPISEGSALYTASRLSVNTYANEALKAIIVQGSSLADLRLELAILAGIIVVGLAFARILFRVVPGRR